MTGTIPRRSAHLPEILVLGAILGALLDACSTVEVELVTFPGAHIVAALPPPPPPPKEEPKTVQVTATKLSIDDKIQFETWSAEIKKESYPILDDIAQALRDNKQIRRVEIQGHTAKTGQAKRSLQLSVDRASSVLAYLVKKGVAKDRLVAKGYGEMMPVADNSSADGREKNRRVEFVIVEQGAQTVALAPAKQGGEEE